MTSEVEAQANSAVYYEKRYSSWGLRYHKSVIDWMMEGIWPDQQVIDAGCGTGIISRLYPSHFIYSVDVSPEMFSKVPTTRYAVWEKERLIIYKSRTGHIGDVASKIGAPQETDSIVCRSLLHHLPDHKLALAEFHRVLKPGGKLVLWETAKGALAQAVRKRTQHGDRFSEYHHAFADGELQRDLVEAGFKVTEVRRMGFIAYPLWGFPDICDFSRFIPFKPILFPLTMALDYLLESIPWLNRMSWSVGIKAVKV